MKLSKLLHVISVVFGSLSA